MRPNDLADSLRSLFTALVLARLNSVLNFMQFIVALTYRSLPETTRSLAGWIAESNWPSQLLRGC